MDADTFRDFGKAAIEFVANYIENIRDCDVLPSVKPGYLRDLLPNEIPEKPESWRQVLKDVNDIIKPGITHWVSPNMHAYYPTGVSFPSIIGDMLACGFGVIGFSWISSPACTELEVIVMDWLAKFLNLPKHFLHSTQGPGGGVIQGSASESILVAILAAREQAVSKIQKLTPHISESDIRGKLVAYSSDQSNCCVEKAGRLGAVPIRLLETEKDLIFNGQILEKAIVEDLAKGFIPIVCIATLGTTGTCAFDDISTLGKVCKKYDLWFHVDAAYAGAAFALDEYDYLRKGLEMVDSLNYNLHKSLMINFDCCGMWLKDSSKLVDSFSVNRIYLKHEYEDQLQVPDFRHWQIPLGRRFRALKVWITFRTIGADGLRSHIRRHINLAERFEKFVKADQRFEIVSKRSLGLVCFRPKGDNKLTTELLNCLMERKKIYMIQATCRGQNFLRFVVCGMNPQKKDIDFAWFEIQTQFNHITEKGIGFNLNKEDATGVYTHNLSMDLHKIHIINEIQKIK